jgi:hypothetical protein
MGRAVVGRASALTGALVAGCTAGLVNVAGRGPAPARAPPRVRVACASASLAWAITHNTTSANQRRFMVGTPPLVGEQAGRSFRDSRACRSNPVCSFSSR